MASVVKPKYTVSLPKGATVNGKKVVWKDARGKKKSGTLTKNGRVSVEADTWQLRYRDELGVGHRESTKLTSKDAAEKLLAARLAEIERVVIGVATREEFSRAKKNHEPLAGQLDIFGKKQFAGGAGDDHIKDTRRKIETLFDEIGLARLREVTGEKIETWIADQRRSAERAPRTINSYVVALKSFCAWAVETNRLVANPLRKIKKLNEDVDKRKQRRSLTDDELRRLFETARARPGRGKKKREEVELVYRILVGTGLRSKELSLATPSQFDFDRHRFTVKAVATKNKRPDILPIRPDLADRLKAWIDRNGLGEHDRIFRYSIYSLYRTFVKDLASAGIERKTPDGRSIDVHSLRRTFGTMLARAGVPLTTTQRLMRHSTPELTAKLYIDVEPIDMMQAVEKLPGF